MSQLKTIFNKGVVDAAANRRRRSRGRTEGDLPVSRRPGTHRPFTIVVCQRCHDEQSSALVGLLGAAVRQCPQGVLVSGGCWSDESPCVSAILASGPRIALQPCAADRTPNAPTIWLGPIVSDEDARAVCAWIVDGVWDRAALPAGRARRLDASRSPLLN